MHDQNSKPYGDLFWNALLEVSRENPNSQQAYREISSCLAVYESARVILNTGKVDARIFKFPPKEDILSGWTERLCWGKACYFCRGCRERRGAWAVFQHLQLRRAPQCRWMTTAPRLRLPFLSFYKAGFLMENHYLMLPLSLLLLVWTR